MKIPCRTLFRVVGVALMFSMLYGCNDNGEDPVSPPPPGENGDSEVGLVEGTVTHAEAGVGDVEIHLRDGPGTDREMTTGNDGAFEFDDVEAGTWEMEVVPPDYFQLPEGEAPTRSVDVTEGQTSSVTVTLEPVDELEVQEISATGDLAFDPANVQVAPGTRVRWVNEAAMFHTITPDNHEEWSEGTVEAQGDTFEVVLNNPGEFDYFCVPHEGDGMADSIEVLP